MYVPEEMIIAGLSITLSSVDLPASECLHKSDVREIIAASIAGASSYAERLAVSLHRKHFADTKPNWRPLSGDLIGLLTQIDNMTADLTTKSIDRAEWVVSASKSKGCAE